MDTGSFDLVGFRKRDCRGCGPAASVLLCSAPSCTVGGGEEKCLEYGSGTTCGDRRPAAADVSIGPLTSSGQRFLLGHSANMPVMSTARFQAIVGLGVPQKGELLPGLGARYFSVCLPSVDDGKIVWNDDAPGSGFAHLHVVASRFWGVKMTGAHLKGPRGSRNVGCSPSCGAILDTGTSLIGVPSSTFRLMSRGMAELGESCDKIDTLPSLHFRLGGEDFVLPPTAFVGYFTQKTIPWLPSWLPQPVLLRCELLMVDMGELQTSLGSAWILGMPFFRHYYTTFDLGARGGTDVNRMMVHTAPTGGSCVPGDVAREREQRLMTVDPHKLRMPRWVAGAAARPGAGNSTELLF
ncbi:unnamed protein product [Prorocentrum cordatum]|uniref:Peptidase A1 domain-containing protein n=1 Tax=Prorocentrum cordatum TaxID=2364126 RepID=A0ABN9RYU8_9DINO|nr:unnamed protein product [Polarella glacialis]